ncbi:Zn-ribbon domain-containing OB-fold protein [Streptomyces sp. VRA16 Mangrove soil]|uniref:Zn-ribbon domain-containing OB-fold protein n=1 Tax=Streptomyces sp. VRA16 Mangrove soil TaxID=2817434 RepID=UPI001A9DFCEA|nr:zinc ribbon domain-containing protein [Streptomyces sp. VRA16 Mangrove soil]MBO1331480.1 OB-fold domain-containing protein [Streptomyces sp. VRA16 Mangrove soil]
MTRTRTPVVAGWFAGEGDDFRLLGTRCSACASVYFPREDTACRNPGCSGGDLAEVPLSRRGRIWSYTDARYRPPEPYVSDRELPWQPYTLIAVELAAERLVVLGQGVPGLSVTDLEVGMEVEVVPGVLDEDGDEASGTAWTTWHWRPTGVTA